MRVLIAIVVLGGCYDPAIDECQFRCGPGNACPGGTACTNGFCRSSGVSCSGSNPDGNIACPQAPQNCDSEFAIEGSTCASLCTMQPDDHENADSACNGGWRLAILDSIAKLDAIPTSSRRYWVGATRPAALWMWKTGTAVSPESWASGMPPVGGDSCASLDAQVHRLKNDIACGDALGFICTYP